jgi:hypothetical protein
MAWVERFTCDVCGKLMGESESWWVAANECASGNGRGASQPVLKLMPWDNLHGHSAGSKHLCGAGCAHTFLDRWMAEFHAGVETCVGDSMAPQ